MPLDLRKPLQKAQIGHNIELFKSGMQLPAIVMIHSGKVDLFWESADEDNSLLLWQAGENSICGAIAFSLNKPTQLTAITAAPTIISVFPVAPRQFSSTIRQKPNLGFMLARSMLRQLMEAAHRVKQSVELIQRVEKMRDNFGMALYKLDTMSFSMQQTNAGSETSPLVQYIQQKSMAFFNNNQVFPTEITTDFLSQNLSDKIESNLFHYNDPDQHRFLFYRRFLSMPGEYQQAFFSGEHLSLLPHLIQELAQLLEGKISQLVELHNKLIQLFSMVGSESDSLFSFYYELFQKSQFEADPLRKREITNTYYEFMERLDKELSQFKAVWATKLSFIDIRFATLLENIAREKEADQQARNIPAPSGNSGAIETMTESNQALVDGELKDSMQQILTYSGLEKEKSMRLFHLWREFSDVKNKLDSESELRKMRRNISKLYWEVYGLCMSRYLKTGNAPKPVELMFNYGFFNEKILNPDKIGAIYRYQDLTQSRFQIMTATEWLDSIYKGKFTPSQSELGEKYLDVLRNELRGAENIKLVKNETMPNDSNDRRLAFEVEHVFTHGSVQVSGTPGSNFPILIDDLVPDNIADLFVTRKKIEDRLNALIEIDFSVFYREVLFKGMINGIQANEFVRKEIFPVFIQMPVIGLKIAMWQEIEGTIKESPARFLIPSMFIGQLEPGLIEALGVYRWEIVRSLEGASWADIDRGSLTADYFDYQEFYKKNNKLSPETKEKLAMEFKKFRDPKSRFVNDYKHWMQFEKDGIPKLNAVAREVFVKHVPFRKEKRDSLMTFPAYNRPLTRYENINQRKKKELENRYHKYKKGADKGGEFPLPDELQANLDLFDV